MPAVPMEAVILMPESSPCVVPLSCWISLLQHVDVKFLISPIIFQTIYFLWFIVVQSLSCVWLSVIHGLQCARLPCPSLFPWVCSNLCPLSWWWHPVISSSVIPFSSCLPSIFPNIRAFPNDLAPHIRWTKYWSFSFSISPSNEYSGLISFRIDWLDLLAVRGTLKHLL